MEDGIVTLTVEEFQNDFDNLMDRVKNGEHIAITNGQNTAVMVPADDELLRMYSDHDEGP